MPSPLADLNILDTLGKLSTPTATASAAAASSASATSAPHARPHRRLRRTLGAWHWCGALDRMTEREADARKDGGPQRARFTRSVCGQGDARQMRRATVGDVAGLAFDRGLCSKLNIQIPWTKVLQAHLR